MDGSMVAPAYERGEILEIAPYNAMDVRATAELFQRVRDEILRYRSGYACARSRLFPGWRQGGWPLGLLGVGLLTLVLRPRPTDRSPDPRRLAALPAACLATAASLAAFLVSGLGGQTAPAWALLVAVGASAYYAVASALGRLLAAEPIATGPLAGSLTGIAGTIVAFGIGGVVSGDDVGLLLAGLGPAMALLGTDADPNRRRAARSVLLCSAAIFLAVRSAQLGVEALGAAFHWTPVTAIHIVVRGFMLPLGWLALLARVIAAWSPPAAHFSWLARAAPGAAIVAAQYLVHDGAFLLAALGVVGVRAGAVLRTPRRIVS